MKPAAPLFCLGNLVTMKPFYRKGYQSWVSDHIGLVLEDKGPNRVRLLFAGAEHSVVLPAHYFEVVE